MDGHTHTEKNELVVLFTEHIETELSECNVRGRKERSITSNPTAVWMSD